MIFCTPPALFAQQIIGIGQPLAMDTMPKRALKTDLPDTITHQKKFAKAAGFLVLMEVLPWTFDKFIKNADYAQISFKTVGHNLNPGSWAFDNDPFGTNQFGHPYHGSYFFSAFRANGYTFWEAAPAAFVGSYIWETAAENQAPSPNDFVNTSFGGIVLGEMTYRLSNRIINNRARGFKRQVSEVLGFVVNPMNGLSRLLDGRWGRVAANPVSRDSTKISAEFDAGLRRIEGSNNGKPGWYGHAKFLYGNSYENYKEPFSNIYINTEFGKDDSSKVNIISVYGSLIGWKIGSNNHYQQVGVLSANYDYIRNRSFFYSGQSVKFNLFTNFNLSSKVKVNTSVGVGPIILAAVPDPYFYKGRNYDYGSGLSYSGTGGISFADKLFMTVNYRGGWLKTVDGNSSHSFLHTVSGELSYMFVKGLSICAEPGYFVLNGKYKLQDDVNSRYSYLRTSLRYAVVF